MQAVKGYLSNGWFTPNDGAVLPNHIEAVLVFGEGTKKPQLRSESDTQARMERLNRIEAALALSRDEDLSNFPKQGLMKVSYDDWLD